MPNVFLTSHIATSTDKTYTDASVTLADDIISYIEGRKTRGTPVTTKEMLKNMT